ncbi:hypothetical protein SADUNF_Sadunf16G0079800 [Salix dunnii]|uniref:Uncharacterized protein n=1 Tax=Salix dunnii TaxID=1413687 RepID=A0A835ML69_9ROSI|nr:hypothetical protein SADUNF_Sadunf16G0079800 [Salix dunnii]
MASKKLLNARANYIYPTLGSGNNPFTGHDKVFDFDEADVWSSNVVSSLESKKTIPSSRSSKKAPRKTEMAKDRTPVTCESLPVNIPDWSKIYRDYHQRKENENSIYQLDDDDDQDDRVPPHEYLARRRGASFSVHEGIGRTLKGRDLRQILDCVQKMRSSLAVLVLDFVSSLNFICTSSVVFKDHYGALDSSFGWWAVGKKVTC